MEDFNEKQIVKAINKLIEEAVCDGADAGGAYHQNTKDLIEATINILNELKLNNYTVYYDKTNLTNWSNIKVISKKEKELLF